MDSLRVIKQRMSYPFYPEPESKYPEDCEDCHGTGEITSDFMRGDTQVQETSVCECKLAELASAEDYKDQLAYDNWKDSQA